MLKEYKGSLDAKVHDLTESPHGDLIQEELLKITGQRTVPYVFVRGAHIGGNSELQELYHSDKLEGLLFPDIPENDTKYRAIFKGMVVAESDEIVRFGLSHYFPPSSLNQDCCRVSSKTTFCPAKGEATHYIVTVEAGGKKYRNAAWTYQDPLAEAQHIKNYVSFMDGVAVWKGRQIL